MVHEMLIQSWNGKIRIFPGIPDRWKDAVFNNLRAEGAFLVSARRKNGRTDWIRVTSLAGEPCVIKTDFNQTKLTVLANRKIKLTTLSHNEWSIDLRKDESAVLYASGERPVFKIEPLTMKPGTMNFYGIKAQPWNMRQHKKASDNALPK